MPEQIILGAFLVVLLMMFLAHALQSMGEFLEKVTRTFGFLFLIIILIGSTAVGLKAMKTARQEGIKTYQQVRAASAAAHHGR